MRERKVFRSLQRTPRATCRDIPAPRGRRSGNRRRDVRCGPLRAESMAVWIEPEPSTGRRSWEVRYRMLDLCCASTTRAAMFLRSDLDELLSMDGNPSVSLYLPTHVATREMRQDRVRLRNL